MISAEGYTRRLDVALGQVIDSVVATYLHGSAALGGFMPGRSDIDVLAICGDRPTDRDRLNAAAQTLQSTVGECPGRGVELSIVARRHAHEPGPPWPFVLHVTTCPGEEKVVFGDDRRGDPDLLMHYVACRAAGIALRGPAPKDLIGTIARADVLRYLGAELDWALKNAPEAYAVLNACRALAYLDHDEILSKIDGAHYALKRGASHELITGALAMQSGDRRDQPPSDAARRFIIDVSHALETQQH